MGWHLLSRMDGAVIVAEQLLDALPADPVILEAGAHWGTDTVKFAATARMVHAFEPVPACYTRLRTAVEHLPNVMTYPVALADEIGPRLMWVSAGEVEASSSLHRPTGHLTSNPTITFPGEPVRVPAITLDLWAAICWPGRVDGMWLDMQGGELDALNAAGPLLADVKAMMLEVSLVELYEGCPLYPEVCDWLERRGFSIAMEDLEGVSGDILAVRA